MREPTKLTPEQFARFQRLIYRETGIHMQEGKITLLSNRIRRRLKHHGLESFEDYYDRRFGSWAGLVCWFDVWAFWVRQRGGSPADPFGSS